MSSENVQVVYPRRQPLRAVLRGLSRFAVNALARIEITGEENYPQEGPLIVVSNHFYFADPVLMIALTPWPLEFMAGTHLVTAPQQLHIFPRMWGVLDVARGSVNSRRSLRAAESVLNQKGVLGVYPEAGAWARVLRKPRPGTAYLAARTGARLLPVGVDNMWEVLSSLRTGRRATINVRIGKPFGPYSVKGKGRERRAQLDEISNDIMMHIAELLPPKLHGYYSVDPVLRQAAIGLEEYPEIALGG